MTKPRRRTEYGHAVDVGVAQRCVHGRAKNGSCPTMLCADAIYRQAGHLAPAKHDVHVLWTIERADRLLSASRRSPWVEKRQYRVPCGRVAPFVEWVKCGWRRGEITDGNAVSVAGGGHALEMQIGSALGTSAHAPTGPSKLKAGRLARRCKGRRNSLPRREEWVRSCIAPSLQPCRFYKSWCQQG